jgi:Tol biopolymer transport system component/DNA-binding winged helix-turn-helix (wHTH) protein
MPPGFRFATFELDVESRELRKSGIRLKCATQPLLVLELLLANQGRVVTRESLQQSVWPDEPFGDHDQRLNKVVNKVREVLGDSSSSPRFIETLPKVGYRFVCPAERLDTPAPAVSPPAPAVPPPSAPWRFRAGWLAAAAVLLTAGSLAAWIVARQWRQPVPIITAPLTTYPGAESSPSFSPDGSRIAFQWDGSATVANLDIYVLDVASREATRLTQSLERESHPAWSPDGANIAFVRDATSESSDLWLIAPDGGNSRRLTGIGLPSNSVRLSWILAPDRIGGVASSIFAIDVVSGERRRITIPSPGQTGDLNPAISPDGTSIAFTRDTARDWRDIFVAPFDSFKLTAATPTQVTQHNARVESMAWTPDGAELVFASSPPGGGPASIHRVMASGGAVQELAAVRLDGHSPAISRSGALAFSRQLLAPTAIQRVDLTAPFPSQTLVASTSRDYSPDFSGDGKQVVMSSVRGGSPQLWVFPSAGGSPRQLTFLGDSGASVPRWSYDGQWILFESRSTGAVDIHALSPLTRQLRRITNTPWPESRPSWSRDGASIYFSRVDPETGVQQIYRQAFAGQAEAVRITRRGAAFALESVDGRWLYLTSPEGSAEIRRMPRAGGPEVTITSGALGRSAIAVAPNGVYYLTAPSAAGITTLNFLPEGESAGRPILTISKPVHNAISLSPDFRTLIFTQNEQVQADLIFVSRFR